MIYAAGHLGQFGSILGYTVFTGISQVLIEKKVCLFFVYLYLISLASVIYLENTLNIYNNRHKKINHLFA